MQEVSQEEYYAAIGKVECAGTIIGGYPYTMVYTNNFRQEIGRSVDAEESGQLVTRYYLADK